MPRPGDPNTVTQLVCGQAVVRGFVPIDDRPAFVTSVYEIPCNPLLGNVAGAVSYRSQAESDAVCAKVLREISSYPLSHRWWLLTVANAISTDPSSFPEPRPTATPEPSMRRLRWWWPFRRRTCAS